MTRVARARRRSEVDAEDPVGHIAEPDDAQYIFDHTDGIVGFFGASSIERLPTEVALENQARRFKSLNLMNFDAGNR